MGTELLRTDVVQKVAELSSKYFGMKITENDIKGVVRTREMVMCRCACSMILLRVKSCSLTTTGFLLNKHHSTIINHRKQFLKCEGYQDDFCDGLRKLMNDFICPEFNITIKELY